MCELSDPRENCPWKCNHCLCYQGEIERLTKQVESLQQKVHLCAGYDALTIENNNLKQDRTEIHWWCEHEDLTSNRKIQKIMDVCGRDISNMEEVEQSIDAASGSHVPVSDEECEAIDAAVRADSSQKS